MSVHGYPTAARGDDNTAPFDDAADRLLLDDLEGPRTGHDTPQNPLRVFSDNPTGLTQLLRLIFVQSTTDGLRRLLHLRSGRVNNDLGDLSHDSPFDAGLAQSVLEGLLDHVADPTRGGSDENTERLLGQRIGGQLVPQ